MKVNVVYAHPARDSYLASLHRRVVEVLKARGDEVVDFDLYAMKFDPVMQVDELKGHAGPSPAPADLQVYIDALQWAEACVFCFPTWWSGMPAVLKGYFDRVWRAGRCLRAADGWRHDQAGASEHPPDGRGHHLRLAVVVHQALYAGPGQKGAFARLEIHVRTHAETPLSGEILRGKHHPRGAGKIRSQGGAAVRTILSGSVVGICNQKQWVYI
ncbi:NAD(P)H-dependent oxidoreductase [Mesorhizobium sp. CA18]|uniref:NAD(P)H-dependent oxidoreductase n=1 Tax=unclassified Mesorhizobium TaxID=325217 RepID=UPI001CCE2943|nr:MULTISPECIES: NAD(P)H-dependent oxidoreductase [unclassified Mesorhizobium]MBZ9736081.1 NAD(P)H-dependent oxidoreductase [Mesorhizobium sp. CA9]MBZ9827845.1 NAD(P)H-dependent oxidoreductase [Mesorhizobium sp. CA18]MBZ9833651.1 NAD(P)H-dependent oxidoreductase [Mesorhizobium sp. CA2]MBZ9839864.1 NAD(P)H-dependent oxidoreductase [Mesorhizobium sp. CA3]MBZ9880002.1 NAD(P)H-dependent oxidoreductase [Mesorhizobium sp. Ca11]